MDAAVNELVAVLGGSVAALIGTSGLGLRILGNQFENESWQLLGTRLLQATVALIILLVILWFVLPGKPEV